MYKIYCMSLRHYRITLSNRVVKNLDDRSALIDARATALHGYSPPSQFERKKKRERNAPFLRLKKHNFSKKALFDIIIYLKMVFCLLKLLYKISLFIMFKPLTRVTHPVVGHKSGKLL